MSGTILAIDPGTTTSAYVLWDGERVQEKGILSNDEVVNMLFHWFAPVPPKLVIEQIESYGMPIGRTTLETVFWSGRFCEAWPEEWSLLPRRQVKLHLCGTARAKDSNIIQALKDRFGDKPTPKKPNWIYGEHKLKRDEWQAFALAVTAWDLGQ